MHKRRITLNCGDGTQETYELIKQVFVSRFSNPILDKLSDAADLGEYVFSCDAFTVNPLVFPSSDIGKLSVYGTVNDICVSAASPQYISVAMIVEEGFSFSELESITDSIKEAASVSGVKVVAGDFKVVEKGKVDRIFIITSGIGKKIKRRASSMDNISPKDKIIVTGPIAEHGITVLLARSRIFDFDIKSDCQSLKDIVLPLWKRFDGIRFMRDPTRGGLAGILNEISYSTGLGIRVFEEKVPLKNSVRAACELLGIDPYYLASEGRAVIVADRGDVKEIVKFLKSKGEEPAVIGDVTSRNKGVVVQTVAGGKRILDFSYSFTLPRIC